MAGGSQFIGGRRAAWDKQDSYDSPEAQLRERRNYVYNADRGNRRYDPHTRKYVLWEYDNNYVQDPLEKYPLFTQEEHERLAQHPRKRRPKSKDWGAAGPKASPKFRLNEIY
ncbi:hypothetical protein V493_05052 [Pseudogymnoascus sp. VKM F-4281 (FW-2241)]|nr:hypothetical protein V493_05052 [Pseudogymnoascus sp. VKM F-4281 (FW-2241)]